LPKQYHPLAGRAIIEWALTPFLADSRCAGVCVALAAADTWFGRLPAALDSRVRTTLGGAARADSVEAALAACGAGPEDWVLVHDAARPCLAPDELDRLLAAASQAADGALLALPLADTLKRAAGDGHVLNTESREQLWRAQTPQMFRCHRLAKALRAASAAGRAPTDEAQAIEWIGGTPLLVPGSALNIKVTTPEDLALAEAILGMREGG
jgi:2-C-methyl-D-erythritol 4-phosphate cytidylyltransferase